MSTSLLDIQTELSARFETSGGAIDPTTNEWARRTNLIKIALRAWRERINGKWAVLGKAASLSTTVDQSYVTLPAGYRRGRALADKAGFITIGTQVYKLVDKDYFDTQDTVDQLCYITGSDPEGYRLNIQPTPTAVTSFTFPYFTSNTATDSAGTTEKEFPTEPTDLVKCPNPGFISEWVLGELFLVDNEDANSAKIYKDQAESYMKSMIVENARGEVNQSFRVLDPSDLMGYEPIGGTNEANF